MKMGNTVTLGERMAQAQSGDKAAYASLLHEVTTIVRAIISRKISSHADVEDIVQEVLLSVHKARHTYDSKRPFRPWLYAITQFRLNDSLRKKYRRHENETIEFSEVEQLLSGGYDAEEGLENSSMVQHALEKLPERQRKIVTMMKMEGYSAKEVADSLGMQESAVKVSAHRAYKRMRKEFT